MSTTPEQQEAFFPGMHNIRISQRASSIPDWRIRQLAAEGMISPFEPAKIREVEVDNSHGQIFSARPRLDRGPQGV